ncbi:MAG TPA: AAC(3) family N-acetyltransferase [Usitatibacter sp.]|jgi:aminoglycoside 3-N-acetyltransferase|nr:AAC(3) family N-acetyltransferase [Usitatibacter sp.]
MSERAAIARSREPVTAGLLKSRLSDLGIAAGDVLLVHCSLSALGWVCGGPVTVIEALLDAVGPEGTVAMPAHSTDLSEPSNWMNPPVPAQWCSAIRATMPAFDPRRTPTRAMGAVAEIFRTWPGAFRSDHPTSSIAAIGPHAAVITSEHPLDDPMGDASPLGKLYALDARIVLAGVGHDRNTSLHLAERRAFGSLQARTRTGSPVAVEGRRQWVEYQEPLACSDDFAALGEAFEAANDVPRSGALRAMRLRELVDFGAGWLPAHRQPDGRPWTASSSAG